MAWKIGVNSQARRLIGSAPGWAGVSGGMRASATGSGRRPTRRATPPGTAPAGDQDDGDQHQEQDRAERGPPEAGTGHGRGASLADRVISARIPRVAARDPLRAHPAALEQAVLLDRLLRVARAGRLEPATRGQPGEDDPVEPDQTRSRCASRPLVLRARRPDEDPAQRPDQRVMVGLDDRGPGDDEDVPAGLERGRHHPERLAEPPPDPVADDGAAELAPGRQPEPGRLEVGPQEPGGEERVGPGRSRLPGSPRSPAGERASRAAASWCRAPSSGRQPLSTACPPSGQDTPTAGRLHPGAEAVLLGAMALLGLVGLLHRGCSGSSPSGLGDVSSRPRKARKRAWRPKAHGASSSGG